MGTESSQDSAAEVAGFWASACGGGAKRWLVASLVACFVIQTGFVYLDPSQSPPLSEKANEGRRLWHRYNCQGCHQFYGFGGFLGPDLTNAAPRVSPQRLHRLLTEGSGLMPAYGLPADEIAAVGEFLSAMNETGQGQARVGLAALGREDPAGRLVRTIRSAVAETNDANTASGLNLFILRGCQGCHIPFGRSFAVPPDVLTAFNRLDRTEIEKVLRDGRLPGMPPPVLSSREREEMYEFLGWLGDHQYSLLKRSWVQTGDGDGAWSTISWWEYR